MRKLCFFLLTTSALAQPNITGTSTLDTSWGSMLFQITTSAAAKWPRLEYQLDANPSPTPPFAYSTQTQPTVGINNLTTLRVPIAGLAPATSYRYRLCASDNNGVEACAAPATFTTAAAPANRNADPTLPSYYDPGAYPTITGNTYTVAANCSDLQTIINTAAALADANNHLIQIPNTTVCHNHQVSLPSRAGTGWIVISSQDMTKAPPAGTTLDAALWDTTQLASLSVNNYNSSGHFTLASTFFTLATGATHYWISGVKFTTDLNTTGAGFAQITAATNATPIQITTGAAHGYNTGDVVQVGDVGGNTAANGHNWIVTKVDNTNFTLNGSVGNGVYTVGGWTTKDSYSYRSFMESPSPAFGSVSYIVLDRIAWQPAQFPMRAQYGWYVGNCDHCAVIESYFDSGAWMYVNHTTGASPLDADGDFGINLEISFMSQAMIRGNIFRTAGITVFAEEAAQGTGARDLLIYRNKFKWNTQYFRLADGFNYYCRQPLEFKTGLRIQVDGNEFANTWTCGQTGNIPTAFLWTPRVGSLSTGTPVDNSDLTISNNWFHDTVGALTIIGNNSYEERSAALRNVLVTNNLIHNIDATLATGWVQSFPGISGGPGGNYYGAYIYLGNHYQNFRVEHNTFGLQWGNDPAVLVAINIAQSSAFQYRGNIAEMSQQYTVGFASINNGLNGVVPAIPLTYPSGSAWTAFQGTFTNGPTVPDPYSAWTNNIAIPGVTTPLANNSLGTAGYSKANCDNYWSGFTNIICMGTNTSTLASNRFDLMGFMGYSTGDYRLLSTSPVVSGNAANSFCVTNPTLCTRAYDWKDMGINWDQLNTHLGNVTGLHITKITATTAEVDYTAPDTTACTVEYGTSAAYGTGSRIADGGTTRWRAVALSGLTTATTYYVRALCAVQQPNISFTTH